MTQKNDLQINEQAPQESIPATGLKKASPENKQATWAKVEVVVNAAKDAYFNKGATLADVVDSLVATLMDFRASETQKLGGLGAGQPEMDIPAPPAPEELPA